MLFQQFLPAARQISSDFIFQLDSAAAHRALEAINFPPITLPNVELFQQEGQHPLTGQHAANFRLLANQ